MTEDPYGKVVKIMVPFLNPIVLQARILMCPNRGHNLDNLPSKRELLVSV